MTEIIVNGVTWKQSDAVAQVQSSEKVELSANTQSNLITDAEINHSHGSITLVAFSPQKKL